MAGSSRVVWNLFKETFVVYPNYPDTEGELTLREFYIKVRQDSGITVTKLAADSGITPSILYSLEGRLNNGRRPSNSIRAILIALETMGFNLELHG